jgi:hypothetical protein
MCMRFATLALANLATTVASQVPAHRPPLRADTESEKHFFCSPILDPYACYEHLCNCLFNNTISSTIYESSVFFFGHGEVGQMRRRVF